MGVLGVGFSVVVLKVNFNGTNPPPYWVQRLTYSVLVPGGCWNGCSCGCGCFRSCRCKSTTPVLPIKILKDNKKANTKHEQEEMDNDSVSSYDLNYTWRDVANILDRFLFVTSLSITTVATLVFMIGLKVGGSLNAESI